MRPASSSRRRSIRRSAPAPIGSATSSPAPSSATSAATDYWAKDLPVNRGRYNFDEFATSTIAIAPPSSRASRPAPIDLREEFTSRDWATAYDIPAVKEGRLHQRSPCPTKPSGAQGFFLNTRRPKFADVRVRKALDYAFDFEWTNKNIFYGSTRAPRASSRTPT